MVILRRAPLPRYLLLAAMLALLLFLSSWWLPQGGARDCGSAWLPCLGAQGPAPEPPLGSADPRPDVEAPPTLLPEATPPLLTEAPPPLCPGQRFQARLLLQHLRSSLSQDQDVLLEPYLLGWDQLLLFMDSLGSIVSFFSHKVKEKVDLIRQLSIKDEADYKHGGAQYGSVRSMVGAELGRGLVDFSRRSDSGCRTLLRLHRSLLWLQLMLEGLCAGPGADGRLRTPGEISRDAYQVALAPHHSWYLRQAAELAFLALPDRRHFLQLVCVRSQSEAAPALRVVIGTLAQVHARTQQILAEHDMLALP